MEVWGDRQGAGNVEETIQHQMVTLQNCPDSHGLLPYAGKIHLEQ